MIFLEKQWFVCVLLMGVLAEVVGCGPARPLEIPESPAVRDGIAPIQIKQPSLGIAAKLGIRLVPEKSGQSANQGFPKPDFSQALKNSHSTKDGIKYAENSVAYARVLEIPNSRKTNTNQINELFFVWPENSLGSKIVHVSIVHLILDGHNRWIGNLRPTSAWHEADEHLWFLPLSELFNNSEYYKNSLVTDVETQFVTLELTLFDQSRVDIQIKFRAKERK